MEHNLAPIRGNLRIAATATKPVVDRTRADGAPPRALVIARPASSPSPSTDTTHSTDPDAIVILGVHDKTERALRQVLDICRERLSRYDEVSRRAR